MGHHLCLALSFLLEGLKRFLLCMDVEMNSNVDKKMTLHVNYIYGDDYSFEHTVGLYDKV